MKINVNKFKQIVNQLFEFLEENEINNVEFDEDLYWNIVDAEIRYNPELDKDILIENLGLGSLIDEWEFIASISEREKYEIVGYVSFCEAAEILKYLGYKSMDLIKEVDS